MDILGGILAGSLFVAFFTLLAILGIRIITGGSTIQALEDFSREIGKQSQW